MDKQEMGLKPKKKKIKVNGKEKILNQTQEMYSYDEIVSWVFDEAPKDLVTVIFHQKEKSGTVVPGQSIKIKDGMLIEAMILGGA